MSENLLKEGMKAPGFSVESSEGGEVSLEALRGKVVVLYFYPKDDTPGCTKEACSFRDADSEIRKLGAVVLGVSKDGLASHGKFKAKYSLNFPLLSDPEGKLIAAYGVWKDKSIFGHSALGIQRSTFVIDREGIVRKAWYGVKVDGHADEVLQVVRGL